MDLPSLGCPLAHQKRRPGCGRSSRHRLARVMRSLGWPPPSPSLPTFLRLGSLHSPKPPDSPRHPFFLSHPQCLLWLPLPHPPAPKQRLQKNTHTHSRFFGASTPCKRLAIQLPSYRPLLSGHVWFILFLTVLKKRGYQTRWKAGSTSLFSFLPSLSESTQGTWCLIITRQCISFHVLLLAS